MHLSQKSIFIVVLQELWRFAIIRELPSPLMFAFIRDQVGLGRFYIKWQWVCFCCQTAWS